MAFSWRDLAVSFITLGLFSLVEIEGAQSCCNPLFPSYADPCFTDDFNVEIDFIFWKPCLASVDYAAVIDPSNRSTDVHFKDLCLDWTPGVKATIGRPSFFYDWGFIGTYIFLESKKHSHVIGEHAVTTPLFQLGLMYDELFNKASASYTLIYQEWETLLTYEFSCLPCTLFTPFFGVAGIYVDQDFDLKVFTDEGHHKSDWDSLYWGVGLRAGADYQFYVCRCLRLYSTIHGTILAGRAKNDYKMATVTKLRYDDDTCCHFVPGCYIGTGIYYDTAICDVEFTVRLGYEFRYWYNMPRNRVFSGHDSRIQASHSTSPNTRTLGYQGLTAGVAMTF